MKICITCEGISETDLEHCAHCGTRLLSTGEVHFPLRRGEEDAGHPLIGQVVDGKYRLLNVVGKGGMGTVFRAEHEISQVPVAVKVMHPRHAARSDHRAWFLAEARKAGRVVHEHSARILDVGETADGMVFIAMELVEGASLSTWLAGDPLPVDVTTDVLAQMARALSAAHQAGVVHRDLTPRNVMVSLRDGRAFVKILDFGIAKGAALVGAGGGDQTPIGFATPPYSAPEHLDGSDVDGRADLYSLGVIAFEMLVGRPPVHGASATELIQATLDSDLELPRSIPGVPGDLLDLLRSLLARDPDDRPDSAVRVAVRLVQMLEPRGRRLAAVALVFAVSVALAIALLEAPTTSAGMVLLGDDSKFAVASIKPRVPIALRTEDLSPLRFEFRGFDPRRLQVEVRRNGGKPWHQTLGARITDNPTVFELTTRSPDYEAFVERVRKESALGPVDIEYSIGDGHVLCYARFVLDDTAPELDLTVKPSNGVITGATRLQLGVRDSGTLSVIELHIDLQKPAEGDGANPLRIELSRAATQQPVAAFELLKTYFSGAADRGVGQMWLEAVDRAGNRGQSERFHFGALDLRAPEISFAPRRGNDLTYHANGVSFQASISADEEGLEFRLVGPFGHALVTSAKRIAGSVRVYEIEIAFGAELRFLDGTYKLSLLDRYGNSSKEYEMTLHFRSADLTASLSAGASDDHVIWLHDQEDFVTDGAPVRLTFKCSDLYTPESVVLQGAPDDKVILEDAGPGRATVVIGDLPDGQYTLQLELASDQDAVSTKSYQIRVLGKPVELRLPDVHGARFLEQLRDASLLKVKGSKVSAGLGWRLTPQDARLLNGWIWVGDPPEERFEFKLRTAAVASLLEDFELRNGLNCISVELRDVFMRPIRVFCGDTEPPLARSDTGGQIQELLRFYYHDAPIEAVDRVLRVEHGQPTRLQLRSALPFRQSDEILLLATGRQLEPQAVEPVGDGTVLTFELPWAGIANLPAVGEMGAEQFISVPPFALPVSVRCPAGEPELNFMVQPIRSSLVPVLLADLTESPTNSEVAEILMVPIPGLPERGEYLDPVSAEVGRRRAFRLAPPTTVRNIEDFYLQKRELTRGQYEATVLAALARSGLRDDWRQLVHAADPLGKMRLAKGNLVPKIYADNPEAWQRAHTGAPQRAVNGVDFFQAYTVTRLVGVVIGDDPDLFRLPTGIELEYAGYGLQPRTGALRLHRAEVVAERFHRAALALASKDPARWPLSSAACLEIGDFVNVSPDLGPARTLSGSGTLVVALDFGLREWVFDLPFAKAKGERQALRRGWMGNHADLVRHAQDHARGTLSDLPADLVTHFSRWGVVRGLASGEVSGLKSGVDGRQLARPMGLLENEVPGLLRELAIRRDGSGLLSGSAGKFLHLCGFRLAGGNRFIVEVRQR